jgi:CheY-like chemotaxis protein
MWVGALPAASIVEAVDHRNCGRTALNAVPTLLHRRTIEGDMATPRIVVADDHDNTRAWIAGLLSSDFDVVATVVDGQAAVEAAAALHPDLVVLDISMPRLNGFEAGALIKDLPDPPRIVFVTACHDASVPSVASALGASAVVPKVEMLTELVPAVRRALLFHAVCFYEDSASLARTVARFIGEGLAASQAAVIVATASHGAFICDQLAMMGVDSEERIARGELLIFDAKEVLNRFMVGNRPDAERFEDTINPLVAKAAGGRKRLVRIYGEMVDVLWSSGREEAALSLEILWHQLVAGRKCSLLCGYSSGVCEGEGFNAICDRHTHVMPPHAAM